MSNEPYQQIPKPEPEGKDNVININEQPPMAAQQPMLNPPLMTQQPMLNPPLMVQQPVVMVNQPMGQPYYQPPMGQAVLYPQQQQTNMFPNGIQFIPPNVEISKGGKACIIAMVVCFFCCIIAVLIPLLFTIY